MSLGATLLARIENPCDEETQSTVRRVRRGRLWLRFGWRLRAGMRGSGRGERKKGERERRERGSRERGRERERERINASK